MQCCGMWWKRMVVSIAMVEENNQDKGLLRHELPSLHLGEDIIDVRDNPALSSNQQGNVQNPLLDFKYVLTDIPGKISLIEHEI